MALVASLFFAVAPAASARDTYPLHLSFHEPGLRVLAAGNVNHDGKPDLLAENTAKLNGVKRDHLFALRGTGDGTFAKPKLAMKQQIGNVKNLTLANFNGDSKPDAAYEVSSSSPGASRDIRFLAGVGGGRFEYQRYATIVEPSAPNRPAIGDFNGDGLDDLAVVDFQRSQLDVWTADATPIGTTAFWLNGPVATDVEVADRPQDEPDSLRLHSVAAGQFAGGTDLDLMVFADEDLTGLKVQPIAMVGDGHGGFTENAGPVVGEGPVSIAQPADMDGDGRTDIVADEDRGLFGGGTDTWFTDSSGTSTSATHPPQTPESRFGITEPVGIGDFNGDGREDFAGADDMNFVDHSQRVDEQLFVAGSGGRSFSPPLFGRVVRDASPEDSPDTSTCTATQVADFNGDGADDTAFSCGELYVALGTPASASARRS